MGRYTSCLVETVVGLETAIDQRFVGPNPCGAITDVLQTSETVKLSIMAKEMWFVGKEPERYGTRRKTQGDDRKKNI
jgi:hypothetical protein